MGKYVEATQRTRAKLREAFWLLYQKKPIEKITVREISELSHYNRSTFYEYYPTVYAVLEEIEEELLRNAFPDKSKILNDNKLSVNEMLYEVSRIYKIYKKYLTVLLGENGDPQFISKLKEHIKELIRPFILTTNTQNQIYVLEYMANGFIGLLLYWQLNDEKLSIVEFKKITEDIIFSKQPLENPFNE